MALGLSWLRSAAVLLALACGLYLLILGYGVFRATHPARNVDPGIDFEALHLRVDEVRFESTDGVSLRGWRIPGQPGRPAIVLCHDYGSSKAELTNLAIALRESGFHLLLFDFRGHGQSGGSSSTLGVLEMRDVVGAVDFLGSTQTETARPGGIFGVGMGAHAAVLAAAERPKLRVLVLDGLYPDADFALLRALERRWPAPLNAVRFLPLGLFHLSGGSSAPSDRASAVGPALLGRDLLLLAPEQDEPLAAAARRVYEEIPDQVDVDGNLLLLPATLSSGLRGSDLTDYLRRVTDFFESRLGAD